MNQLRASLYAHISAERWKLLDQGFIDAADSVGDTRLVSLHGSSQFPAIFSFDSAQRMSRCGSWFQWSQDHQGLPSTFALRFASPADGDAFRDLLPSVSIISRQGAEDRYKDESGGDLRQHLMASKSRSATSPVHAEMPAYMHHIIALSHDLQYEPALPTATPHSFSCIALRAIRSDCVAMSLSQARSAASPQPLCLCRPPAD